MLIGNAVGNIGNDSETRTVGETTVTSFNIASNRKVKGEDKTTWIKCDYWGKPGEAVAPYLKKGTQVAVFGELETEEYDKRDGSGKGFSLKMRIDRLQLCGGKRDGETTAPRNGSGRTAAPSTQDDDSIPF